MQNGSELEFDRLVMATHADQALRLLTDASPQEKELLGTWHYQKNHTVLHTDVSVMPTNRRAWASWNYRRESGRADESPISLSYHMNRLQGLRTEQHYFVTLNRNRPYAENSIIREIEYTHPVFTRAAIDSQKKLPELNGQQNTYYCGSYFGYGFHEDAVRSAVALTQLFGIAL
jgi:predicted NAD/FAD-binding protein